VTSVTYAIGATMQAAGSTPLVIAEQVSSDAPPSPPKRKSIPTAAPPSRDVPQSDGKRFSATRTVTLSPEERNIARRSFGTYKDANGNLVNLSAKQRERPYGEGKAAPGRAPSFRPISGAGARLMTAPLSPTFSPHKHVNDAVIIEAYRMGANPYCWDVVRDAPMTIADLIEKIRFLFGDRAAASIAITVH
jgi:hypothetical protein